MSHYGGPAWDTISWPCALCRKKHPFAPPDPMTGVPVFPPTLITVKTEGCGYQARCAGGCTKVVDSA